MPRRIKKTFRFFGKRLKKHWKEVFLSLLILFLIGSGASVLWLSTLKIPDLESFDKKLTSESTKIYDKTGEVLLFSLNPDVKRDVVPFSEISDYAKKAVVAIEDKDFYIHKGVKFTSFIRAVLANLRSGELSQGGSTITQQVVKNSILTNEKRISRKIKEWVLSFKLEKVKTKDEILGLYLNGIPYGGNMYGIEQASQAFFAKKASDITLAEAAYLAAIPKAPTRYSPYGTRKNLLDERKNLVLGEMLENNLITEKEYEAAKQEVVEFKPQESKGIKAPHFVTFVREYLVEKYGEEKLQNGGLKVITTLDYKLQEKAEELVKTYALENKKNFNAENAALVAINPRTGAILSMVGSRDYFDKEIDGAFNVTTAHRQPGSAFKPIVYAAAFNKGYTPDTVLFDLETEFTGFCEPGLPVTQNPACYRPKNYDLKYSGPISIRNALALSVNIPAVKTLYLVGIDNAIRLAKDIGIGELAKPDQYGLTLVLGGGEVSLLDMTSAYSVFANNGIRNSYVSILKIEDKNGNVLEEYSPRPTPVLPEQTALQISDILKEVGIKNNNIHLTFSRDVAAKTGTTNDYKDAWVMGYTPSIAVGAWAGNNNNTSMEKKVAGFIVAPLWGAFMREALKDLPEEEFKVPLPIDENIKPTLRGIWQGGVTVIVDRTTGQPATDTTPAENREERAIPNVHSILYWVNKNDPMGSPPTDPNQDPQFKLWEYAVQVWAATQTIPTTTSGGSTSTSTQQTVELPGPTARITYPVNGNEFPPDTKISVSISYSGTHPLTKIEYYVNGTYIGSGTTINGFAFSPRDIPFIKDTNELKVVVKDTQSRTASHTINFKVKR